jgi:alkylated DNA repair dioxygenase AlkB
LPKGVVHLPAFVPPGEQLGLVVRALELGARPQGRGFFLCDNERTKRMKMMNLGKRTEGPGLNEGGAVPGEWSALAQRAAAVARRLEPSLPAMTPDVCVVNVYTAQSKLSPHVDVLTRRDRGAPIVSVSLGLACDFVLQRGWGKKHKAHTLRLGSGDALVFGGGARDILHSVPRVYSESATPHGAGGVGSGGGLLGGGGGGEGGGGGGLALDRLSPEDRSRLSAALEGLLPREELSGTHVGETAQLNFRLNLNFREK